MYSVSFVKGVNVARVAGRLPLTKEQIVQTALNLMDRYGVEAISMRRLASELQVRPMALYYYFKHKEALLDAVVDAVLSECDTNITQGDWREQLRSMCWSYRRMAQRHPKIFPLAMTHDVDVPNDYVIAEAFLTIFAEAGLSPQMAVRACNVLITYVAGFAVDEVTGSLLAFDETAEAFIAESEERFPQLYKHRQYLTTVDLDAEFEYGLSTIIKGIDPNPKKQ